MVARAALAGLAGLVVAGTVGWAGAGTAGRGDAPCPDDVPAARSEEEVEAAAAPPRSVPTLSARPARPVRLAAPAAEDGAPVERPTPEDVASEGTEAACANAEPPLSVRVVDAETGEDLRCEVRWIPAGGDDREFVFDFDLPEGYLDDGPRRCAASVSRYATSLAYVHPLRPEARVTVAVLEYDGAPAAGAALHRATVAGSTSPAARLEGGWEGTYLVRGVPFLRGEPLALTVVPAEQRDGFAWRSADARFVLPQRWGDALALALVLPEPVPAAEEEFVGARANRMIRCCGSGCGRSVRAPEARPGRLRVVGRRRDGSPARGARVLVNGGSPVVLDARGRAEATLPGGLWTLRLSEVGLVPVVVDAVVVPDQDREVVLVEPAGATLEVDVVDVEGVARPFARAEVDQPSGLRWADLADGVQRIDSHVDELGRRTFARVEPGRVRVRATWAGRRVEAEVDAREGGTRRVRLVVPAAGT